MVNRNATSPWPFVAAGGMALAFFCYFFLPFAYPGIHIPWWSLLVLAVVWFLLLGLLVSWFTRRPGLTMVVPVLAFAFLIGFAYAGGRWWGWTA